MTESSPSFRFEQFAVLDLYTIMLNRDLHGPCSGSGVIAIEVNGEVEFEPCVCSDHVSQAMIRYLPLFLETFQEVMVHRVREVEWQDRVGEIVVQERLMEIVGTIVNYFLPDNYVIVGVNINQFDEVELTVMRPGEEEIAYRIFKAATFESVFRLAVNKLADEELEIEIIAFTTYTPDEDDLASAKVVLVDPIFHTVEYTVNGCQGVLPFTSEKEQLENWVFPAEYFLKEVHKYYANLEDFMEIRSTQSVDLQTTSFDYPLVEEAREKDLRLYFVTFSYRDRHGAMLRAYSQSIFQQPSFNFDALLKAELIEFIIENPVPKSWELHLEKA